MPTKVAHANQRGVIHAQLHVPFTYILCVFTLSSNFLSMSIPPFSKQTSLSALAGLVLGLPVRMDLVADIPFETLRLEVRAQKLSVMWLAAPQRARSHFFLSPCLRQGHLA